MTTQSDIKAALETASDILAIKKMDGSSEESIKLWTTIQAVLEASLWKPISEAPKDGRAMLLFEKQDDEFNGDYMFTGYWGEKYGDIDPPEWICLEYEAFTRKPTHFMSLPAPPEEIE